MRSVIRPFSTILLKRENSYRVNRVNRFVLFNFIVLIVFFVVDSYRIKIFPDGINLTIARSAVAFLLMWWMLKIFRRQRINLFEFSLLTFLFWFSILTIAAQGRIGDYQVMLTYCVVIAVVSAKVVKKCSMTDLVYITYSIRIAIVLLTFFSIYTLSIFFATGAHPDHLPIEPLHFLLDPGSGHVLERGGFRLGDLTRVALPFFRPQDLGITTAILFFLLLSFKRMSGSQSRFDILLFIAMILLTLLSGSRSAILPFIVGLTMYLVLERSSLLRLTKKRLSIVLFLFFFVGYFLFQPWFLNYVVEFSLNFERVFRFIGDQSFEGHIEHRLTAFHFASENWITFFAGSGIGGFSNSADNASPHSTFFLFIVDVGLIGIILFIIPHFIAFSPRYLSHEVKNIGVILFVMIILSHLFYNFTTTVISYLALGMFAGLSTRLQSSTGVKEKI
jgi:hypothetical protein